MVASCCPMVQYFQRGNGYLFEYLPVWTLFELRSCCDTCYEKRNVNMIDGVFYVWEGSAHFVLKFSLNVPTNEKEKREIEMVAVSCSGIKYCSWIDSTRFVDWICAVKHTSEPKCYSASSAQILPYRRKWQIQLDWWYAVLSICSQTSSLQILKGWFSSKYWQPRCKRAWIQDTSRPIDSTIKHLEKYCLEVDRRDRKIVDRLLSQR